MKSKFNAAAFISLAVFVCVEVIGCQTSYSVKVIGEASKPTFVFEEPVLVGYGGFAYVSKIHGNSDNEERIWLIECNSKEYFYVSDLSYGVVPDGFIEKIKPLSLGEGYYSFVITGGGVSAHTNFRIERVESGLRITQKKVTDLFFLD